MKLKLNYPSAIDWMWNYCTYLGPFIDSDGNKYDLGIYLKSAAIVFVDTPGDYHSGTLDTFGKQGGISQEIYDETRKRATILGLYNL